MRAVLQRVTSASVEIDGTVRGSIGKGLVILVGVRNGDTRADAEFLAQKCVNLRIFADQQGKFNLSALDVGAELLAISQFTLYADCRRGRRPGFTDAAPPEVSRPLYEHFVRALRGYGLTVAEGVFGAHMVVHINNDGPVTVIVDTPPGEQ
ncbi:MAG: D-tyrosyl-tRNA(Tyr) deacylase [Calditrichaeota bacterium]|nr:D-tyrosyl-tRNA(Tyr) deacylase [Calditrichota bacterium]